VRRLAPALALAAALAAAPAPGAIPSAVKIAEAVARANAAAGRSSPLWMDVQIAIGDGGPAATGVLASHPTGLARLELHHKSGFVERHLLLGDQYEASRDGQLLPQPHPFLPPIFLLQATSGAALQAALGSFGVESDVAGLGRLEDRDCFVLGGRAARGPGAPVGPPRPALWVDAESFELLRLDRADGVQLRFGPALAFGEIRAPGFVAIESPGRPPVRLEITRVAPANAPAAGFTSGWLTAPAPAAP
jgi:hypothetical protein